MRGNGTAGPVMHRLLQRLNVEATELFFDMDGRFPNHHPDPTVPANLQHLQEAVKAHQADLGIAFDGDSDRIGAVDENGDVIYGDMLLLIFGREILTRKPGATFIGEVKCSQVLYDELKRLGGNPIMYKTGHSLIKAKMKEAHAELAGEMSGHMFFADRYFGYDDALYAACRLMEIVSKSGKPLSAQLAGLPKLVSTPEIRVDCPDETKFARGGARRRTVQEDAPGDRRRWRARAVRAGLGTAARLQHAAGAGDALRSRHRAAARRIPARSRIRPGGRQAGDRLSSALYPHVP